MEAYLEGDGGFRLKWGSCGWKERPTAVRLTDGRMDGGREEESGSDEQMPLSENPFMISCPSFLQQRNIRCSMLNNTGCKNDSIFYL